MATKTHVCVYDIKKVTRVLLHSGDGDLTGYDVFTSLSCKCGEKLPPTYERTKL